MQKLTSIPLPHSLPHICGQCVSYSDKFAFFGGFTQERPLKENPEKKESLHSGKIYTFSLQQDDQIYESKSNIRHTQTIAATTVLNDEIGISFTFGGLSQVENENTTIPEVICTSNLYGHRWTHQFDINSFSNSKIHFHQCNFEYSFCTNPVDDIFNAGKECSDMFGVHNGKEMFTPSLNSEKPTARYFHSSAWDEKHNLMWIFGGLSIENEDFSSVQTNAQNKVYLNDTWCWNIYTGMWKKITIKNSPSPRIGASMTYMNGKLFLFGGFHHTNKIKDLFYYLDISKYNGKDEYQLSWILIPNIPQNLTNKFAGVKILPYSPSLSQSFIIFSGGSSIDIYDSITLLEENTNEIVFSQMELVSYDLNSGTFEIHLIDHLIPEISYHSAAIINDKLCVVGGIIANHNSYSFHKFLQCFDIFSFFSKPSSIDQSLVIELETIPKVSCSNEKLNYHKLDDDLYKIDSLIFKDFKKVVAKEIERISKKERVQNLFNIFQNHQKYHFPLDDFIISNNVYASKQILQSRIGNPIFPTFQLPHELIYDLIMFAYTDVVDPANSKLTDIYSFMKFLDFCRERRLYRLMAFEIGIHIQEISPSDFLSICLSTKGFPGQPMFDDSNLNFLKTLFSRSIQKYHSLADFSLIEFLSPKCARFIHQALFNQTKATSLKIAESTLENDLACIETDRTFEVKNGFINIDHSALQFNIEYFSQASTAVVRAIETFSLSSLFDINDTDDIFMAFKLICTCKTAIDDELFDKIMNDSKSKFLEHASHNLVFKKKLCHILPSIKYLTVIEFATKMIGINGATTIIGNDQINIQYDCKFGIKLPSVTFNVDVGKESILFLIILMYSGCKITDLPSFFDRKFIANELLTLSATCSYLPPHTLRKSINNFIIETLFSNEITNEIILENFPRLFNAGIHEDVMKYADVIQISAMAAQPNYINNFSEEQIMWLIEQCNNDNDYSDLQQQPQHNISDKNNLEVENGLEESETDEDFVVDDVSIFSK
ncbi:hypothetical protein TRFO_38183 [Tritrichomonas foetus]|uniref:BTB domain-containing protein n=1 Tax=Tritrichomonas foetus TaxID=1144522 RepID=A0A1J4JEI9_9EUKA|nr:hypothetical protein TRFO_38183 [Tritrichomonas foetus]|eukprot:OHS95676.1 hypothetical protein TRFO_38183 [Tritrichomonas foetus]